MLTRLLKYSNKKYLPENYKFGPDWIILGVNNTCNLHCKMCDVGTKNTETNFATNLIGTSPLNMPLELYKTIIDQTKLYYPSAKIGFAFTEPMAYPFIVEAIAYAKENGFFTSVTTNALLLPNKAEAIVKAGLDEIFISLDGLETTHNEIRGNEKSFAKAIEGIEKLVQLPNPPKISIASVITEWNISELLAFVNYFRSYPIEGICFMHSVYGTYEIAHLHNERWGKEYAATATNVDEVDLNKFDLSLLLEQIHSIKNETYPFKIAYSPELHTMEALKEYYLMPNHFIGKKCNDVFTMMMFKSDGSVIPAHGRCYNLTVGNIYKQNIKEIWNSSVFGKFRKDLKEAGGFLPACSRCCSAL